MRHLGDITKLNGFEIPVVDCVIGGSPCQDLSVAGLRAGIKGARSSLFMEQIRIVKEMRENDRRTGRTGFYIRPRFMVWENVEGAFSSPGGKSKGEDFRAVLTEIAKISEPECPDVPLPEKGKWSKSGAIMGIGEDGCPFSIAWRLHDAQLWGVPQRRKRISLVADFGGLSAPEICFERKGLSWDPHQGGEERKEASGTAPAGADKTSYTVKIRGGVERDSNGKLAGKGPLVQRELSGTLGVSQDQTLIVLDRYNQTADTVAPTLKTPVGGDDIPVVYNGSNITSKTNQANPKPGDPCHTLTPDPRNYLVYSLDSVSSNSMKSGNPDSGCREVEVAKTLDCFDPNPAKNQGGMIVLDCSNQSGYPRVSEEDISPTLRATAGGNTQPTVYCIQGGGVTSQQSQGDGINEDVSFTLNGLDRHAVAYDASGSGGSEVSPTIVGDHNSKVTDTTVPCMDVGFFQTQEDCAGALLARQYKDPPITYQETTGALMASGYQKLGTQEACNDMFVTQGVVRRLTPMECERLQGFPDHWTDIGEWVDSKGKKRKCTDGARYKALGNSIALPFWFYLLRRISAQYERAATMGSLFDGIGGFPLCWERCNGKGTAVWASEIEEFPIAVTKRHFPEAIE